MKAVDVVQKSSLEVAGESVKRDALLRLGAMMGATVALEEIVGQLDAKRVELAKRTRDSKLWADSGYESWEACCKALFGPKRTVNYKIKELEEQGADYLGISSIVRVGKSVWALMDVEDGEIIYNGERIAITKANEAKIREAVAYYHAEAKRASEALKNKTKALEASQVATKAAEQKAAKAQEAIAVYENPILSWKKADDKDHALLLQMQASLDLLCVQLGNFAKREISPANQTRVVAFCKYAWAAIHQAGDIACAEYGVGLNTPVPAEWLDIDLGTEQRRDLVNEYNAEHLKK